MGKIKQDKYFIQVSETKKEIGNTHLGLDGRVNVKTLSLGFLNNNMETIATTDTSDSHINHCQPPGRIETKRSYMLRGNDLMVNRRREKKIKIRGRQTGADRVC